MCQIKTSIYIESEGIILCLYNYTRRMGMKLVFRMTDEQRRDVLYLLEAWGFAYDYELENNVCFNPNQNIYAEGPNLVYEGERHPFVCDGGLRLVLKVFGSKVDATVALVEYKTSNDELSWFETMSDWVLRMPIRIALHEVGRILVGSAIAVPECGVLDYVPPSLEVIEEARRRGGVAKLYGWEEALVERVGCLVSQYAGTSFIADEISRI